MKVNAYLNFNGQCAAAFRFYEQVLGGKIEFMQTMGESPMKDQVPAEARDRVMHVSMKIGDSLLMGSDAPPEMYAEPQGIYVSVHAPSAADGERIFNAFAEGGRVTMPFQKTFWSPGFGMVKDRFGTPWMVNVAAEPA